jgi:hypothetical protein
VPKGENTHVALIEDPVGFATIIDLTIAVVAAGTSNKSVVLAPVNTC